MSGTTLILRFRPGQRVFVNPIDKYGKCLAVMVAEGMVVKYLVEYWEDSEKVEVELYEEELAYEGLELDNTEGDIVIFTEDIDDEGDD